MSFLKKISDVIKEVFWIKKSTKRKPLSAVKKRNKKSVRKPLKKPLKKPVKPLPIKKTAIQKDQPEKKIVIKVAKKPVVKKPKTPEIDPNLVKVGEITHYFERIKVCVVKITHGTVLIGDKLTIVGVKSKFVQKVWSMQIESEDVKVAKKGQLIGIKIDKPALVGDVVYK